MYEIEYKTIQIEVKLERKCERLKILGRYAMRDPGPEFCD
jgi:hypothetical protein